MSSHAPEFPKIIQRKLLALQRAFRAYVLLDGMATTALAVFALFWADLALDRFFEFSLPMRALLLAALIGGIAYIAWLRIVRRVRVEIRDDQWAMIFERFVPRLDESLLTAVELEEPARSLWQEFLDAPEDEEFQSEFDPYLLSITVDRAAENLRGVNVRRFFRYGRLTTRLAAAALAVGLVLGFCAAFAETAETWFSRNVLLSDRQWPRRSLLSVEGFQDGYVRIGRGDSFTMTVRASMDMPLVPETIRLRVGSRETGFKTIVLDQFRIDTLDGIDWRTFTYTFAEVLESLPLTVRGADSTIRGLYIEVVPPPILSDLQVRQSFPGYMDRPERTVAPSARTIVPDGTSITLTGRSNKPLRKVATSVNRGEPGLLRQESDDKAAFDLVEFSLDSLREDTLVEFFLEDVDSLRNRQAMRVEFVILKDRPPTVTARLDGIGSAITPSAVLPTSGEITDDNGLALARYRYDIEPGKAPGPAESPSDGSTPETGTPPETAADPAREPVEGTLDIPGLGLRQTIFTIERTFPVASLNLQPGDKLGLLVEATDHFDLDGAAGQTAPGTRWALEVVSPERLKSLLEVREIALRQRFEVLIGEVELTRSLIADMTLDAPSELREEIEKLTPPEPEDAASEDAKARQLEEFERLKTARLETISREQAGAGVYNISRALRDTQKEVYELRTLVESFRLIRAEMVNNRIFTEDTEARLDRGVLLPIQGLIDADFPETDRLIGLLNKTLEVREQPLRPEAIRQRKEAVEQFDLVVKKMQTIRDNMVSMESFNEAIEILRAIIKEQQKLRNETIERKNQRLKGLLGE